MQDPCLMGISISYADVVLARCLPVRLTCTWCKALRGLFLSYPRLREEASCGSARPALVVPPSFRNR
jgi:hypothetical protein